MNLSWKSKTCEQCEFRCDYVCRRNPPTLITEPPFAQYPTIAVYVDLTVLGYKSACAEYREHEND